MAAMNQANNTPASPLPTAWPANPLLRGVKVLDLSRLLPGPLCGMLLAQLGAEVTKIEDSASGGDYTKALLPELHALVNRGKVGVVLDLRKPAERDAFLARVDTADVVLESFRPGVLAACGCAPAELLVRNPRLVVCSLTGYGQSGHDARRAGHDLNYAAQAGTLHQQGAVGGTPAMGNLPQADIAGGALCALAAILAALRGVAAGGPGTVIDAAMLDGLAAINVVSTATVRALGHSQPRGGDLLSGALPTYGVYRCADGGHVALAALEPKFFFAFCEAVARPDLLRLPFAPGAAGGRLREALTALFATRSRDEWAALLANTAACVSPVLSPEEAQADPHIRERALFAVDATGKPAARFPACFDGARLPDLPALRAR
jgi:alpha-methylacyl-CoA racemase